MSCRFCMYVGQYMLNWLNLWDHALNTLLLGDANETVSARTARARAAGQKWAAVFCDILTFGAKVFTFGQRTGDHCQYALDASQLPNSREIWSWSEMQIDETPESEVDDVEIADKS